MNGARISILIITDNDDDWIVKLKGDLSGFDKIVRTLVGNYVIQTDLLNIHVVKKIEQCGRRRFSCVILDKPVSKEETFFIRQVATGPHVVYADGYFNED